MVTLAQRGWPVTHLHTTYPCEHPSRLRTRASGAFAPAPSERTAE